MTKSNLLGAMFERATQGFLVTDQQGLIQLINPAFCTLFGYPKEELADTPIDRLTDSSQAVGDGPPSTLLDKLTSSAGKSGEFTGRRKDGSFFPFRLFLQTLTDHGQVYYAAHVQDLSLEKINENSNREQHPNRVRSHLLSIASHEFRSPLSQINLSASLIERYYQRLDQKTIMAHLQKIKFAVGEMTDTLNDFLSLERIEAGVFKPDLKAFDLVCFARELCAQMRPLVHGRQLLYRHEGTETLICSDRNVLQNCIINLLLNAVKYSREAGRIRFTTEIRRDNFSITVKDYGLGIPMAEQHRLFEPFFRASNVLNLPGTGLGLYIVQRYVWQLGGSIEVESHENKGTTFKVSFPLLEL